MSMRFHKLEDWLAWQETLHWQSIELKLERVAQVARSLGCDRPACPVITVAGTNGKGSCVAIMEAALSAAGHRVGAYTSPHLLRYNERIRINGEEADDDVLCEAFARIDEARGDTTLTYFEFATLAALLLFADAGVEVAVLEVGMGGRLDAVNIIDADVAVITSIELDHMQWLGDDRETIAREKAGIMRAGRPVVIGDAAPPCSLMDHATALGAPAYRIGQEFGLTPAAAGWSWWGPGPTLPGLPLPSLPGARGLYNAAAAIMALGLLPDPLRPAPQAVQQGLAATPAGRFQVRAGPVAVVYDVAHNPAAALALVQGLRALGHTGATHAVLGMLADKDVEGVVRALAEDVDYWYATQADVPRRLGLEALVERMAPIVGRDALTQWPTVAAAQQAALAAAQPGDRVLVTGSFFTVAEALGRPI